MEKILRPVWAEIDLDALAYNMKNIKSLAEDKEVIAVVKADCYGHGAIDTAPVLLENGASRLAVAVLTEGIELRKAKITAPIMILGYTPEYLGEELITYDIEQTVYSLEYAQNLSKTALSLNKKAKIHIALDTGMGRIGFIPNETSLKEVSEICSLPGLDVIGMFTHFSTADEENKDYTLEQFDKYMNFLHELSKLNISIPLKHVSNSGAIMDMPETFKDLDAVRAGIILYGYYPSHEVKKENLSLKPALTIKAKVSHVKEMDENMYISYGRTFKTKRKSIIATIPIGYADGYSRLLIPGAKVIVNGKLVPIVGRICMDQCMIDVTDAGTVKTGDEVIILGQFENLKINADDYAQILGTINYEVLCMFKHRIPKVYIKNNKPVIVRNYI
ncbi:alanine racemase [Clostridium butyricum]|uniref:alanine racemase n=1 Tax=Clostridium butyricum TaxID=1492 RepID=UPI00129B819F|nr:alanine racemase [Clostridium butyricum]QGH21644.1 alanine racemase [Clostridium butyricum]QGH25683.1 alanine racemase [Clostridium butyricum]